MARNLSNASYIGSVEPPAGWNGAAPQRGVRQAQIVVQTLANPAAASTTFYLNAQSVASVTSGTTFANTTADFPRSVTAVLSGAGTPTLTITGTDGYNVVVSEAIALTGTTPVETSTTFRTVTSWSLSAAVGGTTMNLGTGTRFGLEFPLETVGDLLHVTQGLSALSNMQKPLSVKTKVVDATLSSSPHTETGEVPDNALVLGLTGIVTTLIAGTATSFDVGDGTTADAYADGILVAANTTFGGGDGTGAVAIANATSGIPFIQSGGAGNIVVTGKIGAGAGTITAGAIRFILTYIDLAAPSNSIDIRADEGTVSAGSTAANNDDRGYFAPSLTPDGTNDYRIVYICKNIDSITV